MINFLSHIRETQMPIRKFLLTCDDKNLLERVKKRAREGKLESEMQRCLVLNHLFQRNNKNSDLGLEISTMEKSSDDVAKEIFSLL